MAGIPFLSACSAAAGGGGATAATGGKKTVNVGIASAPDTLDPGATGLALTLFMSFTMFDPLIWWLPTSNGSAYYPGLATSYEVSPDATT